jgi:hypothetical protein
MATVNITEILGTDSISGSRVTINSNFLILQNWINGYITVFGIDTVNGILDLSGASTGKVQAKIGAFDALSIPSTGVPTASVNNLGAASFVSVQSTDVTASGSVVLNGTITLGTSSIFVAGGTSSFNGSLSANGALKLGPVGHVISSNTTYRIGLTAGSAFASTASGIGGGGLVTSVNSPYQFSGLEDVIYANCGPTGFYMKVVDGTSPVNGTPNIPQGTRVTIVNTSASNGFIYTGVTGTSASYYTGFNTSVNYGGYASAGITVAASKAYRSSVTLQWETRVGQGQATQNGSWIVLSATNVTV